MGTHANDWRGPLLSIDERRDIAMLTRTLRSLLRSPRFFIPSLFMLGCGLAVSGTCFALLETTVLNAIPYPDPQALVQITAARAEGDGAHWRLTSGDMEMVRHVHPFQTVGFEVDTPATLSGDGIRPLAVMMARVSAGFFDVLKIDALLGRRFTPRDFVPSAPPVALISHQLWRQVFAQTPNTVGRQITVEGRQYTVVGVMPSTMRRPVSVADIWIPERAGADQATESIAADKFTIGRLRTGVSRSDARRELAQLKPQISSSSQRTPFSPDRFDVLSLSDEITGRTKTVLSLLLLTCLAILSLACLNVGHLQLTRRLSTAKELGIELALGARMGAITVQILTEASIIVAGSLVLALVFMAVLLPLANLAASSLLGTDIHATINWYSILFSAALGAVSCVLAPLAPVVALSRLDADALIRGRWDLTATTGAPRIQDILLILQCGAAVSLAIGAGLILNNIRNLSSVDLGFDPRGLGYIMTDSGSLRFPDSSARMEQILEKISQLPNVKSAATGSTPPLTGAQMSLLIRVRTEEGRWAPLPPVALQSVSSRYFSTMGMSFIDGRGFSRTDAIGAPCVVVINSVFSRLVWSTTHSSGRLIDLGGGVAAPSPCTVIGVVNDARDVALASPPEPQMYLSHFQRAASGQTVVLVRYSRWSSRAGETVQQIISEFDPTRHVAFSADLGALIDDAMRPVEVRARLLGMIAILAMLLAAGGMYSASTYSSQRRNREFGIRMALGATAPRLARSIVKHYARLAAIGGLLGSATVALLINTFRREFERFDMGALDIGVIAAVPPACIALILLSLWLPALRTLHLEPAKLVKDQDV